MKNLNLRSSNFINYIFGKYVSREEQLALDLEGKEREIEGDWQKYIMNYGNLHEKHGIAEWVVWAEEMPNYILDKQKSFSVPNWLDLDQEETISLSSTPDGIKSDFSCILEVKCSMGGKSCYKDLPKDKLPQIYGQQMVLNSWLESQKNKERVEKTHLINWTPNHTKIWECKRNEEFENYLKKYLEIYSWALLNEKDDELKKPIEQFKGEIKKSISLIYEAKVCV
jgi:hypothetical protein